MARACVVDPVNQLAPARVVPYRGLHGKKPEVLPMPDKDDIPIVIGPGRPVLVALPAEVVGAFCDGLVGALGDAAQALCEAISASPCARPDGWYREPLARLDRVRALLDELEWDEGDPLVELEVDLREHGQAAMEALAVALATGEDDLAEAEAVDADRARRGFPPKRGVTIERARTLREFAAIVWTRLELLAREGSEL
jgi:hypothetical protein